ncbi:MFS transporter [Kineosporia sp. NBRC 101677]|uniref:MFS transporter n=1 Tax=Kineosporia sp. NBRC 101677 TaxID=3032197 RepID=UPI0025550DA3|nr:MFS transporter [Kineosporia sp. NBRC 101677]
MLLILLGLLVVGQMYAVLALTAPMSETFDVPAPDITWATTVFGIAYAAGFLVAGPMTDRYGPRAVIVTGLLACTLTTIAVSSASSLGWAVALRAVQGVTAAAFAPAAFAYVAHHIAPARRPFALTCVTSAMLASAIVMQIAVVPVADAAGWRAVFILNGALMAVSALVSRRVLRSGPHQRETGLFQAFAVMPALLRRAHLLAVYGATVCLMSAFVGLYTAIAIAGPPSLAGDSGAVLGLRASSLPALILVAAAAPFLQRLRGPVRSVVALAVGALALLAASLLGAHTVWLGVALFVFVAAVAATAPAIVQTITALAPGTAGAAVALYACGMFIGASLGPQLVRAGISHGFGPLLQGLAGLLVVGALLILPALRRQDAS